MQGFSKGWGGWGGGGGGGESPSPSPSEWGGGNQKSVPNPPSRENPDMCTFILLS